MKKVLVVVESPAKAKTIEKFLGKKYTVRASMGHLRDLPKSQFGVDVDNDFVPKYINIRGKGDIIKQLRDEAKKADAVYLATDPDREGEAIAWHLAHILNIPVEESQRVVFHEITKTAIQNAVLKPRAINLSQVDAQQTRRILDRIVGYKLSPLLWRKVRKGLSAGRVQSVAVRMICDREREIQDFVTQEYWTVTAKLREKLKSPLFDAELIAVDGQKPEIPDEAHANTIKDELEKATFIVREVKRRERRRNPNAPFTTSSLQQDAARKLGFTARKTMMVAQQLYEGLDISGIGSVGLITYMRTDSTRIAPSAQEDTRSYITSRFGNDFLPEKPPVYSNKNAQDAHEAVRPTSLELSPERVAANLNKDQLRLYRLIWERFLASQMAPAIYDTLTIDIQAGRFKFRAVGSRLKFPGFLAVYTEGKEEEDDNDKEVSLPELTAGQELKVYKVNPVQHFTEPPPRYSEATLVKTLEEKGIGRPSTYAPIIETILARGYVEKTEKRFQPTELGFVVVDLLKQYFPDIVDAAFTAALEDKLDAIAEEQSSPNDTLKDFYRPFAAHLEHAEQEIGQVELPVEVSDIPCEQCGKMMVVKHGRYGDFLACPGFPACRNTKPIIKEVGVPCPVCGGAIIERRTKRGKTFYGCSTYPACHFVTWDMPLTTSCPTCGAFMVRHRFPRGNSVVRCSNDSCPSNQGKVTAKDKPEGDEMPAAAKKRKQQATRRKKSV
ncbi:type I DNA topoisomerase [Acetonema longum]|uniref:DNA topoisomerase 1 n=1 Tax=Acetonema longum DSM 6540 TaxID=1009370 RepID=F7NL31_9FIRM|nr:type I DNA topoisomerase [Acetonema longum]EGO63136.1 DNA topoisomerase I [Acetonema longum DSM 6540]